MIIYYLSFIFSGIMAYLAEHNPKVSHRKILYFVAFLPPAIIAGIRYNIGSDYHMYYNLYQQANWKVSDFGGYGNLEIGYYWLEWLLSIVDPDRYMLFIVTAFLTLGLTYLSIYNTSKNITLSVVLIFLTCYYAFSLNVVRQSLSIAFFLYSFKYIIERKNAKYLLCIFIAFMFHYSAIVLVGFYFLCHIKLTKKNMLAFGILAFCGYAQLAYFSEFAMYSRYISKYTAAGGQYIVEGFAAGPFTIMISLMVLLLILYKKLKNETEFKIIFWSTLLAIVFSVYTSQIYIFYRMISYFRFTAIVLLPYVLKRIENPKLRLIACVMMILLFGSYSYYYVGIKGGEGVLPYETIF